MCNLDIQQFPAFFEAGKKCSIERYCSQKTMFHDPASCYTHIALKEDSEPKEVCSMIHTKSRAHHLLGLCISSCSVMHTKSQVGSKLYCKLYYSCLSTLGVSLWCGLIKTWTHNSSTCHIEFSDVFPKNIPFFMSVMYSWFWKTTT